MIVKCRKCGKKLTNDEMERSRIVVRNRYMCTKHIDEYIEEQRKEFKWLGKRIQPNEKV